MAMAQAVLGGRGLHLQCCSASSLSARSLARVRRLSAAGAFSVGSARVSHESRCYVQLIRASGASEKFGQNPRSMPMDRGHSLGKILEACQWTRWSRLEWDEQQEGDKVGVETPDVLQNDKPKSQGGTKLLSIALPILATIVVTKSTDTYYNDSVFIDTQNDWMMPEEMTKNLYMLFSMVFCWGCCVFGSMNDPYYESDEYRGAGGNGTNHWIYEREEAEEQEAREELFREALVKEIEGKVGEMRELEQGADKEKELV